MLGRLGSAGATGASLIRQAEARSATSDVLAISSRAPRREMGFCLPKVFTYSLDYSSGPMRVRASSSGVERPHYRDSLTHTFTETP